MKAPTSEGNGHTLRSDSAVVLDGDEMDPLRHTTIGDVGAKANATANRGPKL